MPDLDFAVLCDYVRVEPQGGVASVVAGGIDTINVQELPTGHNIGLWARAAFTENECGRPHQIEIFAQDGDGKRLVQVESEVEPHWDESLPVGWRVGIPLALNIGIPLEQLGECSFEFLINGEVKKTIPFRVVQAGG